MNWLEKIGLKLVLSWGIPSLAKLLPWMPSQVWDAIMALIRHLAGLDGAELEQKATAFHGLTHQCIGSLCATDFKI